ncbi:MAG: hypothetical protein ACLUDH_12240 [Faecalispora sporosphaeroides]|uniref:hypothetical protein n=1 Tax=Faecalispora sporosphaeroides TaxID=1549 RepID=UPI003992834E
MVSADLQKLFDLAHGFCRRHVILLSSFIYPELKAYLSVKKLPVKVKLRIKTAAAGLCMPKNAAGKRFAADKNMRRKVDGDIGRMQTEDKRLKVEHELLRDFLSLAERKRVPI